MPRARVFSVGYERRSADELVSLLAGKKVRKLIDVRALPLSRRKGLSKRALSANLEEAGIEYVHIRAAGNPYHKERHDIEKCLASYRAYLEGNPEVLETVSEEFNGSYVAVLCYERDHDSCHRSILLDALKVAGHKIQLSKIE